MAFEIWDNHDSQVKRSCGECRRDVWVGRHEEQLGTVYCTDCQNRDRLNPAQAQATFNRALVQAERDSVAMRERWARQDASKP